MSTAGAPKKPGPKVDVDALSACVLGARDFYEALALDSSADDAALKRAANQALKTLHPDKNPGNALCAKATALLTSIKTVFAEHREAYEAAGRPARFDPAAHRSPKRRRASDDDDDCGDDCDTDDVEPQKVVVTGRLQDFYLGHTRTVYFARGVLGDDGTWENRELPFELNIPPRTPNGLFAIRRRAGKYVGGFGQVDLHFVARIEPSAYCSITNKVDIACTGVIDPIQALTGTGAEYTVVWPDGGEQRREIPHSVVHGEVIKVKGHGLRRIVEGSKAHLFGDVLVTMDCEKLLRSRSRAYLSQQQALALRVFGAALVSEDREMRLRAIGAAQGV